MKILQIFEHLLSLQPTKLIPDSALDITRFKRLGYAETADDQSTLYLIETPVSVEKLKKGHFLLVKESPTYFELTDTNQHNIIAVTSEHLNEAAQMILDALEEERVVKNAKERLFHVMLSDKGFSASAIMEVAYELLGNPVILNDGTFKLMSLFPEEKLKDDIWDTLLKQGYLDYEYILKFEIDTTRRKILESKAPIYINWSWAEEIPRLSQVINDGNEVYGYLGVLEYNHTFSNVDYQITELVCDVLRHVLKHNNKPNQDSRILQQTLLVSLLDESYSSTGMIEQANTLGIEFRAPFCLMTFSLSQSDMENTKIDMLQETLFSEMDNIQIVIHHDSLVLFLFGDHLKQSISFAMNLFKQNKISFGMSDLFNELLDTSINYRRATVGYELGKEKDSNKSVYSYSDYVRQFVVKSALKQEGENIFVHSGIQKLIDYDKGHKTNYAITLQTFLNHYKNTIEASKNLHIHRNTLAYRLNKCEEIAGFSLDDISQCHYVQISLDVLL